MYQILFDDDVIYDPRLANPDDKYMIRDASLHLAVGASGSLTFTIDNDHPMANQITRMHGIVEVRDDDTPIFRGRIVRDTLNYYNARVIECEEIMAALNDSIVEPYDFPNDYINDQGYSDAADDGNVVQFWLSKLIENHNNNVGAEQQITLGNVTVTDPNNYIHRASENYDTTWKVISDKLQGSTLGGYLMLRYTSSATYLDYMEDFPLTNIQTVEFASNLLDISNECFGGDLYTAILPLGEDGLTIDGVADQNLSGGLVKSGKIVYSSSGVATYGKITKVVKWSDVTVADNLLTKAAQELAQQGVSMPASITCAICDLSGIEPGVSSFRIGRYVMCVSSLHNLSAQYPLVEMIINPLDPSDVQITLGEKTRTFTDYFETQKNKTIDLAGEAMETKFSEKFAELKSMTENYSSTITQSAQAIVFNILSQYVTSGDLSAALTQFQSRLDAAASSWTLSFNQLSDEISRVDSEWQEQYRNITTWYTFGNDGLEIGKSDSNIKLKLLNDRLSFIDSGYEVAYISDNELYVTDARFLNMLRLGNFGFIPRTNGNLSFLKVQ